MMKTPKWIGPLFYIAAMYDFILGVAFLIAGDAIFEWARITPPNHPGYIQFSAALLIVFGLMFFNVARDPERNRNLIPYGMLLKISYCGVVFYHWLAEGLPDMWKPWAIADLIFLAAFAAAWRCLAPKGN